MFSKTVSVPEEAHDITSICKISVSPISLEQSKEELKTVICHPHLKSLSGLVSLAKEMGASLPEGFQIVPDTVFAYLKAVDAVLDLNQVSVHAFQDVLQGHLAMEGLVEQFAVSEMVEEFGAFFMGIQVLNWVIEDHQRMKQLESPQFQSVFFQNRWKKEWGQAIAAARTIRQRALKGVEQTVNIEGKEMQLGKVGPLSIILAGSHGKPMKNEPFPTVVLNTTTLEDDVELMTHIVPRIPGRGGYSSKFIKDLFSGAKGKTAPIASLSEANEPLNSFSRLLFPVADYPDRTIIKKAEVTTLAAVLPHPPGSMEELLFMVSVPSPKDGLTHIIHGEGWISEGCSLMSKEEGQYLMANLDPKTNKMSYFKATPLDNISSTRQELVDQTGVKVASRLVFVVSREGTTEEQANYWKMILQFDKLTDLQLETLANAIHKQVFAASLLSLINENWLTPQQALKLHTALEAVSHGQRYGMAYQEALALRQKARDPLGLGSYSSGGYGDSWGDNLTRGGGSFGTFGAPRASYMVTGGSSVDTGVQLGVASKEVVPDPTKPPRIYVLYPIAVKTLVDVTQAAQDTAAFLSNVLTFKKA